MDGFQERVKHSIQFRLSLALALSILLVALLAGLLSFGTAFEEANELQDDTLWQVAALLKRQDIPMSGIDSGPAARGDEDAPLIVQALSGHPRPGRTTGPLLLPPTLVDGMHTLEFAGVGYRVLVQSLRSGERIAVAQRTSVRDEIARDSALRTVLPFLLLVPILVLLIARLVRRMVRPVTMLAREIDQRGDDDLQPMALAAMPLEVRPFALAINRLLDRVAQSMATQRRFVADAAHELRSPMTAIALQAERLAAAPLSSEAAEKLRTLRSGIDRGRALLEQLLAMARAQSSVQHREEVSVRSIFTRVIEDAMPQAEACRIDLGIETGGDVMICADPGELHVLLRNLVDNAVRYSTPGGQVDLAVSGGANHAVITVRDQGPGITIAEQAKVFSPFYRRPGQIQQGSGLGLAIVRTIANRNRADIELCATDAKAGTGLTVVVRWPIH